MIGLSRAAWRARREKSRLDRAPSRTLARAMPWLSVVAGSVAATVLWITSAPLMPPFGLLLLIGWRQMRPSLLPVWSGLPLGLFDDLISGQPMGSAVLLWSLAELLLDRLERGIPWRSFLFDWLVAAGLIASTIVLGALIADPARDTMSLRFLFPQVALSILAYPTVARLVAKLDRLRLLPLVRAREWD
jgi:rod shape-determining protein MreD